MISARKKKVRKPRLLPDEVAARAAGRLGDYRGHMDSVEESLPFSVWLEKVDLLELMLRQDPAGAVRSFDIPIRTLSQELGY